MLVWDALLVVAFIYASKRMKSSRSWQVLNAVVLSSLVAHIVSASCQFFIVGRTEKECAVLQIIGVIFHLTGVGLVRIFFTARVSMLSPDSNLLIRRGLVGLAIVLTPVNVLSIVLNMGTQVRPDGVCVALSWEPGLVALFFQSLFFDVVTTAFFLRILIRSRKATSFRSEVFPSPNSSNSSTLSFLTKITIALFLSSVAFSLIPRLVWFEIIPGKKNLILWIILEHLMHATAAALPPITVFITTELGRGKLPDHNAATTRNPQTITTKALPTLNNTEY
jgi:hypothetical protein